MIALSIARRTPASESALEIMLRSCEGAQSKKFRLAAAIAFSYDYGHMSERDNFLICIKIWMWGVHLVSHSKKSI